jgi:small subunit ribosomal protein S7
MSRRRRAVKRVIIPDPRYGNEVVSKFINCMMLEGKRGISETIFYRAMDIVTEKTKKESVDVFIQALENVKPLVEVKSRRVGGATYQVPIDIRPERRQALGIRWLIKYSRLRNEKTMFQRLANEILDANNNTGGAIKKKEDTHKMAEANRAFSHYKW